MQLMPPSATPYAPQAPQESQMLAQALAAMKTQQQNSTPIGGTANTIASALNTFGSQGAGTAGADQWIGANGQKSGNWLDSPLGKQVGGLFGLGQAAQGSQTTQGAQPGQMAPGAVPITTQVGNGSGMAPYIVNPTTGLVTPGVSS